MISELVKYNTSVNNKKLQIVIDDLLEEYVEKFPSNVELLFNELKDAEISTSNFSFYTSISSVYSSKIEGEEIDLDSYIKHKSMGVEFLPDYTHKIDDLYNAYLFAQQNLLNETTICEAHKLLTKNILENKWQGVYRNQNMYVATATGKIEYVAASLFEVKKEMTKLVDDITSLLEMELSFEEVFYYAAMIHLVFVKIHPWNDGNGRSVRLLEKWFLAQKLGDKAWFIQSEKNYYQQHQTYYNNIRNLGLEYERLDYTKALSFLLMLPNALTNDINKI